MDKEITIPEMIESVEKRLTDSMAEFYKPSYSREHEARVRLKSYILIMKNSPDTIDETDKRILQQLYTLNPDKGQITAMALFFMILFGFWWGLMHDGYRIPTAICPVIALSMVGLFIARWQKAFRGRKSGFFILKTFAGIVGMGVSYPLWVKSYDFLIRHDVSRLEVIFSFITMAVAGGFGIIPFYGRSWILNFLTTAAAGFIAVMIGVSLIHTDISEPANVMIKAGSGAVFGLILGLNMALRERETIKDPTNIYTEIYKKHQKRIETVALSAAEDK